MPLALIWNAPERVQRSPAGVCDREEAVALERDVERVAGLHDGAAAACRASSPSPGRSSASWSPRDEVLVAGDRRRRIPRRGSTAALKPVVLMLAMLLATTSIWWLQSDLPRQADELRIFHRASSPFVAEPLTSPGRRSDWHYHCENRARAKNRAKSTEWPRGRWLPICTNLLRRGSFDPAKSAASGAVFNRSLTMRPLSSDQRPDSSVARGFGAWRRKPKSKTARQQPRPARRRRGGSARSC